jgi:hypothetical protein
MLRNAQSHTLIQSSRLTQFVKPLSNFNRVSSRMSKHNSRTESQMTGFLSDCGGATDVPLQGVEDAQWAKLFPVPRKSKGSDDEYSEDGPYGQLTPRLAYRLQFHLTNRVRSQKISYEPDSIGGCRALWLWADLHMTLTGPVAQWQLGEPLNPPVHPASTKAACSEGHCPPSVAFM